MPHRTVPARRTTDLTRRRMADYRERALLWGRVQRLEEELGLDEHGPLEDRLDRVERTVASHGEWLEMLDTAVGELAEWRRQMAKEVVTERVVVAESVWVGGAGHPRVCMSADGQVAEVGVFVGTAMENELVGALYASEGDEPGDAPSMWLGMHPGVGGPEVKLSVDHQQASVLLTSGSATVELGVEGGDASAVVQGAQAKVHVDGGELAETWIAAGVDGPDQSRPQVMLDARREAAGDAVSVSGMIGNDDCTPLLELNAPRQ